MRIHAHLIAVRPSTTGPDALGHHGPVLLHRQGPVDELDLVRGRAGAAPGRQGVHDLERQKRALGEDLADGDGSVEFVPRVLPVHPRQHVLRAEELVSREGPGFAAQEDLIVRVDESTPLREPLGWLLARAG